LREEVAALRARLNALTTLPLSASDPLLLQAELDVGAKTPPRQMPLFGPVHGPPLPRPCGWRGSRRALPPAAGAPGPRIKLHECRYHVA
jgi:hypothetical protein